MIRPLGLYYDIRTDSHFLIKKDGDTYMWLPLPYSTGRIYEDFARGDERFTRAKTVPHHLAIGDHDDRA